MIAFAINRLSRHFRTLDLQTRQILALCEEPALLAFSPRVSRWTVGRQLDHLSRVGHDISAGLAGAIDEGNFGERETPRPMTLLGRVLLGVGWFPRGVAEAPRRAVPEDAPSAARLRESFAALRARYEALSTRGDALCASRARMKHPYFGGLTPAVWVRFLGVHQHHHLKIVGDILRAGGAAAIGRESRT